MEVPVEETIQTETTSNAGAWQEAAAASADAQVEAAHQARPPRRFEQELECELTGEESDILGKELAAEMVKHDAILTEKKAANDGFKGRIEVSKARMRELTESIRTQKEIRNVECIEHFDFRTNTARVLRTDTGEWIAERALRSSELQTELPLENAQLSLEDAPHADDQEEDDDLVDSPPAGDTDDDADGDDEDEDASIDDPEALLDAAEEGDALAEEDDQ